MTGTGLLERDRELTAVERTDRRRRRRQRPAAADRGSGRDRQEPAAAVGPSAGRAVAARARRARRRAGARVPLRRRAAAVRGRRADRARRLRRRRRAGPRRLRRARRSADDGADTSFAILHGLYWLALNLAERKPLLLSVDDLHWCDRPSLRFLAYLVRRLEGVPILVAATIRSTEPGTDAALLAELTQDPATVAIAPGPLSETAVGELVRDAARRAARPRLRRRLLHRHRRQPAAACASC